MVFVIYVSLNYQKLPVAIREKFVITKPDIIRANRLLNKEKSILENVILSTCNRTEVYAVVDQVHTGRYYIKRFLANWFHVDLEQLNQWVQIGTKEVAVAHLFRVAVGLESLMAGEPQILGQVKEAFFLAHDHQTTGAVLDHLFQQAITFSKRMHTEYRVSELAQTSGQAGLHRIKSILGRLNDKRLAIAGMGQEGQHVLKNASTMGFKQILITNRTDSRAIDIAQHYGAVVQAVSWRQLSAIVDSADAVIMATAASQPLISAQSFSENQSRPAVLIDLGVPRNVDQSNLPQHIHYADIDHITQVIARNQLIKRQLLTQIAEKVPKAVDQFYIWQKQLHVVPIIRELRESSLKVEKEVYDSLLRKLPELDVHEQKVIRKHLKSIINQMIKEPIKTIKERSVQSDADADLLFFCKVFGLSVEDGLLTREVTASQKFIEQEKIYEN